MQLVSYARRAYVRAVRRDGLVVGYLEREGPYEGTGGDQLRLLDDSIVISDTAPLADVILGVGRSPRLFDRDVGPDMFRLPASLPQAVVTRNGKELSDTQVVRFRAGERRDLVFGFGGRPVAVAATRLR